MNTNTEADAKALGALLHEVPKMIHIRTADKVGASDQVSCLSHLKTQDQCWGTGACCMKKVIEKRLIQIKTSVTHGIQKEFSYPPGSEGSLLDLEDIRDHFETPRGRLCDCGVTGHGKGRTPDSSTSPPNSKHHPVRH